MAGYARDRDGKSGHFVAGTRLPYLKLEFSFLSDSEWDDFWREPADRILRMRLIVVNIAAMRDAGDAHALRRIVDDIDHTPVPNPYAPLVFIPLELLASGGPGTLGERQNLTVDAVKDSIFERIEFFLSGRLENDGS